MWQSLNWDQFLSGPDTYGIRPVVRSADIRDELSQDDCPVIQPPASEGDGMERPHPRDRRPDQQTDPGSAAAATASAAFAALERLHLAVVLLRADRHVLFANSPAKRIAARRDCYLVQSLQLQLVDQRMHRTFEAFLSARPYSGSEITAPFCVACRNSDKLRYFVFAEWLRDVLPSRRSVVSLLIYEPNLAGQLSHELLGRLYGLTRMESQLVGALFVKPDLRVAAGRGGISLNTAKTHLKHVFAKCGVRSKAELLRLLALGPQTL